MDTKWKKCKQIGSLIALLVGLYLIFISLLTGGWWALSRVLYGDGGTAIREKLEADYQNTSEFRWYLGNRLEDLLVAASGGELGGSYGIYYGYDPYDEEYTWYSYGSTSATVEEGYSWKWDSDAWLDWFFGTGTQMQEATLEVADIAVCQENDWWEEEDWWEEDDWRPPTKEEKEKYIRQYMEHMSRDKNLLYRVSKSGQELYTNAEGLNLDWETKALPEGYNFLLYFDGERTWLYKDGRELDIYENPYYENDDQWYVPGYQNFYVDEEAKDIKVLMAVARQPRMYVQGNYSAHGNQQFGNQLYWMDRNQRAGREEFQRVLGMFILGLALVIVAWCSREQKKTVEESLAQLTGKCWIELKLLLGLGIPLTILRSEEFWYGYNGQQRVLALVDVLLLYLLVNDLRYNRKKQKGLLKSFVRLFSREELKLPVQRRMVYRLLNALLAWPLGLFFVGQGIWIGDRFWDKQWLGSFFILLGVLLLVLALVLTVRCVLYSRKNGEDIGALGRQIAAVRAGNLTEGLDIPADRDLGQMAQQLNDIQQGMHRAMEEQMKSERMKVELVSNVSHDIKTPLTSIISYVELLKQEEGLPDHVRDYIEILGRKSERLKTMVQDVFEVSKASSGQLPVHMEQLDLQRLICQTLADMDEEIRGSGMLLRTDLPSGEVLIYADGRRLYRVFQNLLQNALKYSLPGSRIHVTLTQENDQALARVQNISRVELESGVDFTERFVRGDESRTDGGSGLGLSIARSFTEACGGRFGVRINADLFTAEISFPVSRPWTEQEEPEI
ncbi:MAG: HAMP domain-containing histidine kinase [Lachnospiraceae bacterium]|nr:HAMP domain-containing histidine kinase [Lachnospiraceae bacterium]